jgi:hypothetical protein
MARRGMQQEGKNQMTRNLKVLGLALCAVMAMSAVAASAASAHNFTSTSANGKTILTAQGTGAIFGVKSGILEVKCTAENFNGTVTGNSVEQVTVHPEYGGCNAAPLGASPVDTTGCDYVLRSNTTTSPDTSGGTKTDAPVDLECTAGSSILVTAPGCTITIGAQSGLHGVGYVNEGNKVKVLSTVDNIKYTTPGGFICSLAGLKKEGTDGFLTGTAVVTGYVDNQVGATAPHQFSFPNEGAEVNLGVE